MSITTNFTHTLDDGIEQYAFPSAINPKQSHFIDSVDGGPWCLSLVNFKEELSFEDALMLKQELNDLLEFMASLTAKQIRRTTKPGAPQQEELMGAGL